MFTPAMRCMLTATAYIIRQNMLFTIDESSMSLTDSMYDVSNLTDGYVSHSFNQFIKVDESGKYIYRVDHSESSNYTMNGSYLSVNGITLTKYKADGKSTAVSVSIPVKFDMNKSNYTGASIGGFELGSGNWSDSLCKRRFKQL